MFLVIVSTNHIGWFMFVVFASTNRIVWFICLVIVLIWVAGDLIAKCQLEWFDFKPRFNPKHIKGSEMYLPSLTDSSHMLVCLRRKRARLILNCLLNMWCGLDTEISTICIALSLSLSLILSLSVSRSFSLFGKHFQWSHCQFYFANLYRSLLLWCVEEEKTMIWK